MTIEKQYKSINGSDVKWNVIKPHEKRNHDLHNKLSERYKIGKLRDNDNRSSSIKEDKK